MFKYIVVTINPFLFPSELRSQLKKLISLVVQVPALMIELFVVQYTSETQIVANKTKKNYEEAIDMLEKRKVQYRSKIMATERYNDWKSEALNYVRQEFTA